MKLRFYVPLVLGILLIVPTLSVFAQTPGVTPITVGTSALGVEISNGKVYVTNPFDGTVSVIDKNSNKVVDSISTTKGILFSTVIPDQNKIYLTVWGQSKILAYDLQSHNLTKEIPLGKLVIPGPIDANKKTNYTQFDTSGVGMAYDSNNKMLYVVESEVNQVQIVDTTKDTVVGTIPVGITPTIIQIDSTTNTAYVTNWESNDISIIDLASNKVVGSISTGFVPAHMAIDPVKHKLYVTHHVSPYVSVINLSTRTLESNVQLKGPTHALAVDPKTGLLVVTYLPASPVTGSGYMNRVEIIDTNTDKVINGFDIPANPFEIKISDDQKLFASVVNDGTVYAVDLATNPQYQQIVSQAVPEFGQVAPIVLAIAIMAIVITAAKTRMIPKF